MLLPRSATGRFIHRLLRFSNPRPDADERVVSRGHIDVCPSAYRYADAGRWDDALEAISELIEPYPGDRDLQRQRVALITQVGLPALGDW